MIINLFRVMTSYGLNSINIMEANPPDLGFICHIIYKDPIINS